jgi:hypothetical protein
MGCCRTEWPPESPGPELPTGFDFGHRTVVLLFDADPYDRSRAAQLVALEEAVLSLCRAVFDRDGRIGIEADPDIAPLVAEIGAESELHLPVQVVADEATDPHLVDELERAPAVQLVKSLSALEPFAVVAMGNRRDIARELAELRIPRIVAHFFVKELLGEAEREYEPEELPYAWAMQRLVATLLEEEMPT